MLAEWLGRINTLYGFVPAEELALVVADSVCANLPLPTNGVQEAATDPIKVCMGLPCALAGADARFKELSAKAADEAHSVVSETCLGRCWMTPAVAMGDCPCRDPIGEAPNTSYDLSLYLRSGGYSVLKSCHSKRRSPESIIDGLSAPSLASFEGHDAPLGARLKALRQRGSVPKLLLLAEDGPPGDMCDAFFLEHHPHHVLEGLLTTAFAVGAREVVVHGTPNQAPAVRKLEREFAALAESGLGQHVNLTCSVQADRSPTCDLALLQLLATEAKQPEGRVNGAIPSPVIVLQSIVLRWIPEIISKGADWLVQAGASRSEPLRFYSISGRGAVLLPLSERRGRALAGHRLSARLVRNDGRIGSGNQKVRGRAPDCVQATEEDRGVAMQRRRYAWPYRRFIWRSGSISTCPLRSLGPVVAA